MIQLVTSFSHLSPTLAHTCVHKHTHISKTKQENGVLYLLFHTIQYCFLKNKPKNEPKKRTTKRTTPAAKNYCNPAIQLLFFNYYLFLHLQTLLCGNTAKTKKLLKEKKVWIFLTVFEVHLSGMVACLPQLNKKLFWSVYNNQKYFEWTFDFSIDSSVDKLSVTMCLGAAVAIPSPDTSLSYLIQNDALKYLWSFLRNFWAIREHCETFNFDMAWLFQMVS